MFGQRATGLQFDNLPDSLAKVIADKLRILDLAEKTDALAVLAIAIREPPVARQAAHVALAQVTDGKPEPAQSLLAERAEEIGLVLDGIG